MAGDLRRPHSPATPCALWRLRSTTGCIDPVNLWQPTCAMPPRKKQLSASTIKAKPPAKPRRSKLAAENDITVDQEAEIKEAFQLFSEKDIEGYEDEKVGVLPTDHVSITMRALGVEPSKIELAEFTEILDPDSDGYVTYPNFLAICALKINSKTDEDKDREIEDAFKMFTKGTDGPINIHHLRRVAKELKEDSISEEEFRHMINMANGGLGASKGVNFEGFKKIMGEAGIFP